MVLHELRQREPEMDGTLSRLRGVEHDGGAESRHGWLQEVNRGGHRPGRQPQTSETERD